MVILKSLTTMKSYTFPVSVSAYSEADANAKLNLLLAIGSFFVDFKVGDLACAFAKSKLLDCAGKFAQKKKSEQFFEVFKQWVEQNKSSKK